jgi:predicted enzyme related to lactoylglutathione lyase
MNTTTTPLGTLAYLYLGSADFERDIAYYQGVIGAQKVWHFEHFGARVAAFRVGAGPLVLLADHRPAPSCLLVFEVTDLEATVRGLQARGWEAEGNRFEIPNGPCYLFKDPSGNEFAIFQDVRPHAMEQAYAESENTHAIRD